MTTLTVMCLPITLQCMLFPFIRPIEVMFGRKAIFPVELSYNEEGENLLNQFNAIHEF